MGDSLEELMALLLDIVPEAQEGGVIGLIEDGDKITIDAQTNTLSVDVLDEVLEIRKSKWVKPL